LTSAIFFFRLYTYGNNFYESACQNLDIAGFAGSLQTFSACTSLHKHWQENFENTDGKNRLIPQGDRRDDFALSLKFLARKSWIF
jgi:hypothetical protein